MQNLYDLLGVRPDDDAENLRKAFREAAKASHPDYHGGDPEAAARFRRIVQAYHILRDGAKRAAYDRRLEIQLEVQRRPLRTKLKRGFADLKRHIVTDAIIALVLAIALAGGYGMTTRMSKTSVPEVVGMATPAGTAAGAPAARQDATAGRGRPEGATTPQMPILIPAAPVEIGSSARDRGALEAAAAKGDPFPDPAGLEKEVAKRDRESDVTIDQVVTKASVGDAGKSAAGEPPDPQTAPSGDVPSSGPEIRGVPPASSVGVAALDIKPDGKTPEPAGATAGEAKSAAQMRGATRPPAAMKRRQTLEHAALESRSTPACDGSPSCAGDRPHGNPPPLFGVGF